MRQNGFSKALVAWVFASVIAIADASDIGWQIDQSMPDLASYELAGSIPDISGKVVMIDFWASWCAPCKASFPSMNTMYQKYKDEGFVILAVSVDSSSKQMDRFLKRLQPTFATVHDAKQNLVEDSKIEVMPTSFLIGRDGLVKYRHEGWKGAETQLELEYKIEKLLKE